MKPFGFLLKPVRGISLDRDELSMPDDMAKFIRNLCIDVTDNPGIDGTGAGEGDNADTFTKPQQNFLYIGNMKVPDGVNLAIGYKENKENNRGYVAVWNSKNNHFIYRINGDGSGCQIIYKDPSLNFQLNPKHFIPPTRWAVTSVCITEKGITKNATYIILCDAYNETRFIPEEDSIDTDSFNSSKYPYFFSKDPSYLEHYVTRLGIPYSSDCIGITPMVNTTPGRTNKLVDKTWQFRIKYSDRWGRPSEHGIISTAYYVAASAGSENCQRNSSGITRCVKLKIPAGYPTVEKIFLEYRNCNGNAQDLTTPTDWSLYDAFEKYKDCEPGKQWFERSPNNIDGILTYNSADNTFDYVFCGDKECTAIPIEETDRLFNPLGLNHSAVIKLGNSSCLSNYPEGYENFDCNILDKIKYNLKPPAADTCRPKSRKVRIIAVINNGIINQNQPVWKSPDNAELLAWGGIGNDIGGVPLFEHQIVTDYRQGFAKDVKGFPGYFLGTNIIGISKQYNYNTATGAFTLNEFDDGTLPGNIKNIYDDIVNNNIRVQVWDFDNVPEGNQIFRVAWHFMGAFDYPAISGNNYESTSTFVSAKVKASAYTGLHNTTPSIPGKEIIIPCVGDYDSQKNDDIFLVIDDLTDPGYKSKAMFGYVRDFYNNPIELLLATRTLFGGAKAVTDHNGFYFFSSKDDVGLEFHVRNKCGDISPLPHASQDSNSLIQHDITTTKIQSDCKTNHVNIKGVVKDCNGVGLSGIIIAITRGQYAISDQSGAFNLVAHDNFTPGESINRIEDRILIIQNGVCVLTKCTDKCDTCLRPVNVFLPFCTNDCDTERIFNVPAPALIFSLNLTNNDKGLKSGGTFRMAAVALDWMGRVIGAQNTDKDTLHVPSWQETGAQGFSRLFFDIDPSIVFEKYVSKIIFLRTQNLNGNNLQWVIDKAEYVDATGNVNPTRPSKIKLYITGLANYNLLNNFKTNTTFEFVKGDRIEFINKSDATLFDPGINVLVTDSKDGDYLLVDYDTRLKDLKGGEKIELQHPAVCEQKQFFFEVGCPIRVFNGKPEIFTGEIPTFDTYLFKRKIAYKNASGINTSNVFGFSFEHHSPSDLWGDHCDDRGRINAVNPYQRQKCSKTKAQVSNAFISDKILNGLGRFDEGDTATFDEQEWGGITAMIAKLNTVLVICEHANFITGFKENRIRIDKSGAISADNSIFGRPEKIKGSEYGCQPFDVNTIKEYKDIVCFLDSDNNTLVQHNFNGAIDASDKAEMKSWISSNVKHIQEYNNDPSNEFIKYWHSVMDPKRSDFILTCFTIPKIFTGALPDENYLQESRTESNDQNDTIAYRPTEGILKNFYSFTSEYYGALFSDINDNQLISFKNGLPYFHYKANPLAPEPHNIFFGKQVLPVIEVILSVEPNKVKRYMWNEVNCREQLFFADRIITEAGQASRLLISQWDKRENFWTADFKCNLKTFIDPNVTALQTPENVIFEGDTLYGKWIKIRYIGDPARADKYCELNGFNIFVNGSEKSGTNNK